MKFGILGLSGANGAVGAPPTVINAGDAARHRKTGLSHIDIPATPLRICEALNATRTN
jgi:carbon-monoxide dehydrogenase large subunit